MTLEEIQKEISLLVKIAYVKGGSDTLKELIEKNKKEHDALSK